MEKERSCKHCVYIHICFVFRDIYKSISGVRFINTNGCVPGVTVEIFDIFSTLAKCCMKFESKQK